MKLLKAFVLALIVMVVALASLVFVAEIYALENEGAGGNQVARYR